MGLTVEVKIAWWCLVYLHGVALSSALTGLEPDWEKVRRMVLLAVRLRVLGGRWFSLGR